jgi:hypothetical protein
MFFGSMLLAQDSLQKPTEPIKPPNNSQISIPVSTTSEKTRQRRRQRAYNDSLRFAAERDSIQKATAKLSTANQVPTNPVQQTATPSVTPAPVANVDKSNNPFDIQKEEIVAADGNNTNTQNKASNVPSLLDKKTYSKNFIFWVFLVVLILMAFIVAGGRSAIRTAYQALTSDNALRQIYKEPIGWGSFGYISLYIMFWFNSGIFIFLLMAYYKIKPPFEQFGSLIACITGVSALILLKHIVLYLIATIFPIEKEVRTYNFIIMTVGIILGLILMPVNIFVAYSPASMSTLFIYLGMLVIVVAYLVRSLRSLPIAGSFLIDNRFHFLLYLCTVEIAPLLVITKIVMSNS